MEVKGAAVKSTIEFVKQNFSDNYDDWLNNLPKESFSILSGNISNTKWYSFKYAQLIPTDYIIDNFYSNNIDGAKEIGRYSAKESLHGIFKYFIKLGSPSFLINRAAKVFKTYYKNSHIEVVSSTKTSVILKITDFNELDKYTEARISGWIEKALEISGCKNVKANIVNSIAEGDDYSEIFLTWE
jgi:hypothetical protein